tara:strand:+ start:846 stop:1721 length:876 start_codon:yes stop_codon:yes gene_type:complete
MAFEFRDILPAVGAVIGFGFGGPGGAALGSGIGSLARGDEADEAFRNAALGYAGGQGFKFLGGTGPGQEFLGKLPGGDFLNKGIQGPDIFSTAFDKGREVLGMDKGSAIEKAMSNYDSQVKIINNSKASEEAKASALKLLEKNMSEGLEPSENLLSMKNILGLTAFSGLFGSILDQGDQGVDMSQYMVTTDTPLKGFDKQTPIKNVTEFAADGGLMSLAKGGFPRKNGKIEGPGTETSDDIPAMLSDGEFVVNARTVRGLGESMGGSGKMNARERGAEFLYGVQNEFGGRA